MNKILITGALGQLGTELSDSLRAIYGVENVIVSDIRPPLDDVADGVFELLDVKDSQALRAIVDKHEVTQVYHLAAILSAKGEENPALAWDLNMSSLLNVLDIAKDKALEKIFWPSTIGVFGPSTPKKNTPQHTVMDPTTVYGISKLAGERWCAYYHEKYGVDIRSLRYPGLVGHRSLPGGGTTDYAVDIYHKAVQQKGYHCFLKADTYLPMMYMPDAVKATLELMQAPKEQIKERGSYNIAAISFTPEQVAQSIREQLPDFEINYRPDYRQEIADTWPDSIDDSAARADWGWKPEYDLSAMTSSMLTELAIDYKMKS